MPEKSKFSLVLRRCRENAGLTQKQVADALNMERSTYAYYEMGASQPKGSMILNLSRVLGVDYKELMEAVGDYDFDNNPEDLTYTTFNDSGAKEREQLYTLKKEEQNIIIMYRMMSPEQKKEVEDIFKRFHRDHFPKKRKDEDSE